MTGSKMRVFALAALLAVSGFSALIYQTLWLRSLGLVFGVTVYAASTVLAAFMAGLALGSLLAGKAVDRLRHPVRWLGVAELLIAVSAFSTPFVLGALDTLYRPAYAAVAGHFGLVTTLRFIGSFVVLLIPTTLMGSTMPLALGSTLTSRDEGGQSAAVLYAANTAGALVGAIATGYYFVSGLGMASTFRVAALGNVIVAIGALLWRERPQATAARELASAHPSPRSEITGEQNLVLVVFGISGFTSLALEIVWFRALVMFLPATTYAFTLILATVLGGIALGSALATFWLKRDRDWVWRLAWVEIGIGLAAVGSLAALGWIYAHQWTDTSLGAAGMAVLPATLLMGAAFPIGLHCWTGPDAGTGHAGERIGRFYLVNLGGAILGSLVAGFVLVPAMGTRVSLLAISALSLAAGLALAATRLRTRPTATAVLSLGGVAVFAWFAFVAPDPLQAVLSRRYPGETLLWREEGVQTTVSVQERDGRRIMYLNGLHQADDTPQVRGVHRLIGTLAMLLHPTPREALVIGLGGGVTAGAVAQFERSQVDIVELSNTVVKGAAWFSEINGNVLNLSNVHMRVDDGRDYLVMTPKKYDVITADLIQPYNAGAGNLYSLDYFKLAANVLKDDGVMLQWIGEQPITQYKLIARTFMAAFPNTTVWVDGKFLLGSKKPLQISETVYAELLKDPVFQHAMARAGITGFRGLLGLYTAGPEEFRQFIGDGPVLSDDRPLVEYFLSLPQNEPLIDVKSLKGDATRHLVP